MQNAECEIVWKLNFLIANQIFIVGPKFRIPHSAFRNQNECFG